MWQKKPQNQTIYLLQILMEFEDGCLIILLGVVETPEMHCDRCHFARARAGASGTGGQAAAPTHCTSSIRALVTVGMTPSSLTASSHHGAVSLHALPVCK